MASVTCKTYDIPVYPFVEKFLSAQFDTRPFRLTAYSNPYAGFLYNSLDRYGYTDVKKPKKYDRLTARLTVGIPAWVVRHGAGAVLTPQKISVFNDFVAQLFFEKLTAEVSMLTFFGLSLRVATERFLNRYGITEEELCMDLVLRYYARYRRRMLSQALTDCCPETPAAGGVILPHERNRAIGQVEPWWGQVA